ncbi:hypothetical protein B566_EDAN013803 [Ephemera danica]|nr:hypothetical protein B566_EDAN013803 [Ephemera danica]
MMRSTTKILILATVCCVLVQLCLAQYGGGGAGGSGFVSAGGSGGDGGGGGGGSGGAGGGDGKFFHDIFVHWKAPDHVEFGHISESPKDWEQRFEKRKGHRHQGKVSSLIL